MKAVSLPAHASTMHGPSTAMKNLVGLERQAFNVPDATEPEVPAPANHTAQAVTDGFAVLNEAINTWLGKKNAGST